jgi:hypothetical protein
VGFQIELNFFKGTFFGPLESEIRIFTDQMEIG